jgi:uncharacterized protein (DUF58 family)
VPSDRLVFPLIPHRRLVGLAFGAVESFRRGRGSDVAGSRPYQAGDPVETIDWKASARLSSARWSDEFVIRERHAEEAPRVVVVCDRRPEMALFPAGYDWLSKPTAVREAADLIAASAMAAHGLVGYLDLADGEEPFWRPPRTQTHLWELEERLGAAGFSAPPDNVSRALEHLGAFRADLPGGTFVFVLSDFLTGPPLDSWVRALERGWEVVPVIVQDPYWEQDFPPVASIVAPIVDPVARRVLYVRLTEQEVEQRRAANRERKQRLLGGFTALGMEPILLSSSEREQIFQAFLEWCDRRRAQRGRVW